MSTNHLILFVLQLLKALVMTPFGALISSQSGSDKKLNIEQQDILALHQKNSWRNSSIRTDIGIYDLPPALVYGIMRPKQGHVPSTTFKKTICYFVS
uniref:Uncharacterized protein n=1 Tax=Rhizophora mucronata TaxID=61149 RepID=A0A2P2M912_RHIMU